MSEELPDYEVRTWREVSDVLTQHRSRIMKCEAVTSPIGKVWQAVKWGGVATAAMMLMGASPQSPLGKLVQWFITSTPGN